MARPGSGHGDKFGYARKAERLAYDMKEKIRKAADAENNNATDIKGD